MKAHWLLAAVVLTLMVGCAEPAEQVAQSPASEVQPPGDATDDGVPLGGGAAGGDIAASCAAIVEYDGRFYDGYSVAKPPEPGDPLGTGTIPPCNDTGGASEAGEQVDVSSIPDVDPRDGIMIESNDSMVWLNGQGLGEDGVQELLAQFE